MSVYMYTYNILHMHCIQTIHIVCTCSLHSYGEICIPPDQKNIKMQSYLSILTCLQLSQMIHYMGTKKFIIYYINIIKYYFHPFEVNMNFTG